MLKFYKYSCTFNLDAALKFLKLFWQNCQPAFQHRFELIHPEFSIPLAVSVGSHGMTIKFDQGSSTFIPYRRMKNWKLGIIDGDSIIVKQCKSENDLASREATAASVRNLLKQGITGEERSVNGQVAMLAREKEELYKNVMNLSYACLGGSNAAHIDKSANSSSLSLISSTPILESWVKRANTIRKPNPNSSKRPGLPIKDRLYRYIFTIELQEEYLNVRKLLKLFQGT
jgi:hypothetical protein